MSWWPYNEKYESRSRSPTSSLGGPAPFRRISAMLVGVGALWPLAREGTLFHTVAWTISDRFAAKEIPEEDPMNMGSAPRLKNPTACVMFPWSFLSSGLCDEAAGETLSRALCLLEGLVG